MSTSAVLFDAPGPRTRRRVLMTTVVAGLLLLAGLALVVVALIDRGQFAAELWAPLLDPRTEEFGQVWALLGSGLWLTLRAAAVSMVATLTTGFIVVVVRLSLGRWARLPVVAVVELLRGLPVVVAIVFAAALLPAVGIDVDQFWYLVVGLTAYNSVVISEVLRAGVASLPCGQVEAALAVGLSHGQSMRLVQLPQAVRTMLPALISQLVVILKDTVIGSIVLIGLEDILYQGDLIRRNLDNPLQTYAIIAIIFIAVNVTLSRVAVMTEGWLSRGSKSGGVTTDMAGAAALPAPDDAIRGATGSGRGPDRGHR